MRPTLFALLSVVAMASSANARECTDANGNDILAEPEVFQEVIRSQTSCAAAAELARACAWGSSLDVETVSAAKQVCYLDLLMYDKTNIDSHRLYDDMVKACDQKYDRNEGTLYISMNAYCRLSALEWIVNLTTKE